MAAEPSTTIMLVDLSVDPDRRAEFDRFYHDFYIPEFVGAVPEVCTAIRYAQTGLPDESNQANAHFLTIYEILSDDCIESIETAIARSAHREASDQFKLWKQNGLTSFYRAFYRQMDKQVRRSADSCWNGQSLCVWQWRARPEVSTAHVISCVSNYAKQLMDRVHPVMAHHTYLRLDSDPRNFLTVFEVSDEVSLRYLMQAVNSEVPDSNPALLRVWLAAIVPDQEAMSFNRIYSLPNRAAENK